MPIKNYKDTNQEMQTIIAGLPALPPTLTSFAILGTTYTPQTLAAQLSGYVTTYTAAEKAEQQAETAIEAVVAIEPTVNTFVSATRSALKTALGRKAAALEAVGVAPDKTPEPLTTAQKTAKVAKALATRAARHTLGPKQKKAIKGVVPPASTPAAATPTPAARPG